MQNEDIYVYLMDLPTSVRGRLVCNEDGSFTIILNSRISYDAQLEAYHHELRHIQGNDFQKEDVQQIEASAHQAVQCPPVPPSKKEAIPASQFLEKIRRIQRQRKVIQQKLKDREEQIAALEKMGYDFFQAAEDHFTDPDFKRY